MTKRQTLTEACEEAERTDPAVAKAAASYDEMVERAPNTFPFHYRDGDGPPCSWSGTARCGDEACPNGCSGSLVHYANDGHSQCAEPKLWWHLYGSEVPGLAQDADGNPKPAWVTMMAGEATIGPDEPTVSGGRIQDPLHYNETPLAYLASWDHEPTPAEKEAVTPERYRDEGDTDG